ncbi:hypothetical protein C8J56DRAFT_884258 [Mycena floridula]|nr:hypothetical protein C8J56DRAFT_884258 [Mycena floridula]
MVQNLLILLCLNLILLLLSVFVLSRASSKFFHRATALSLDSLRATSTLCRRMLPQATPVVGPRDNDESKTKQKWHAAPKRSQSEGFLHSVATENGINQCSLRPGWNEIQVSVQAVWVSNGVYIEITYYQVFGIQI